MKSVANSKMMYEAARIRQMMENNKVLPSVREVVEQIARNNAGSTMKRECIVDSVARRMGVPIDESISGSVSNALRELTEAGAVIPAVQHGYWVMCR